MQFFSEYGPFHFKDLLTGMSYDVENGGYFVLKFRDQSFADEVTALTRYSRFTACWLNSILIV
jgi:hypothetical protein